MRNSASLRTLAEGRGKKTVQLEYCRQRLFSEHVSAIMNGDEKIIHQHLRIQGNSFKAIVVQMPTKHHARSCEFELMVFLFWMASGCSYRVAASFIGMSRYPVKHIINKIMDFFVITMRHLIRHRGIEDFPDIAERFCSRSKPNIFGSAIGAIDGTYIRISCPINKHEEYINYKWFYSIQCQAVVDSKLIFNDVFIGYPGSVGSETNHLSSDSTFF